MKSSQNFFLIRIAFVVLAILPLARAQWGVGRDPASVALGTQQLSRVAVETCLPRLRGFITNNETSNLDNLKTKIGRIYGFKRPLISYRELIYKDQNNDKWRVEFYVVPGSKWGQEKYKLKYFKFNDSGLAIEVDSGGKEDNITSDRLLRFSQFENIQTDERWEKFTLPGDPEFSYKLRDFKVFEMTLNFEKPSAKLLCKLEENFPYCQCIK